MPSSESGKKTQWHQYRLGTNGFLSNTAENSDSGVPGVQQAVCEPAVHHGDKGQECTRLCKQDTASLKGK